MTSKKFVLPETHFFFDGKAIRQNDYFFALLDKADIEQSIENTYFIRRQNDTWSYLGDTDWRVATICVNRGSEPSLAGFSEEGDSVIFDAMGMHTETLSDFCQFEFTVRKAKNISGITYVVTYGGIIFQRSGIGGWTFAKLPDRNDGGFLESIDISSDGTQYVVGLNSEVWKKSSDRWEEIDVQSNVHLNDICCRSDGKIYICGSDGILLVGEQNKWVVVDSNVSDDLWRIVEFNGIIYVSSMNCLFELTVQGLIPSELMNNLNLDTFYNLESNGREMLFVGEQRVITVDGANLVQIY